MVARDESNNPPPKKKIGRGVRRYDILTHFDVTDKHNNASFEDLDIHYHSSSCRTFCDTSDSVCLDLQNYRYSIYHECNLYGESQVLALQNTTGINSLEK
jgi:hypothetical protein